MGGGSGIANGTRRYEIRLHPDAVRAYRRLHEPIRGRIARAIDGLSDDPRPIGATKLAGRDDFRIRVGDFRIVYAVEEAQRVVLVGRIAHRRDVYRR